MRFLADENFPLPSVRLLSAAGHDIAAVTLESPGAPDEAVLDRAFREGRILLTFDRDYGGSLYRRGSRLPEAVSDGTDIEARSQMLLAAHVAGRAFGSGTGLGLCHALAHSISARTGAALTVMLPGVLAFNLPASADKLALAAGSLDIPDGSGEKSALAAISAMEDLARGLVKERNLSDLGVTEAMILTLIRDALSDIVLGNNPRVPSGDDVRELLVAAL